MLANPEDETEDGKGVTQVMQAKRASAKVPRDVGSGEYVMKGSAQGADRVLVTRGRRKERGVWSTGTEVTGDFLPTASQPVGDIVCDRHQPGFPELRVPDAKHGGGEVDVGVSQAQQFSRAQSRQIEQDQGGPENGASNRGAV
jgi:hypothetical protein